MSFEKYLRQKQIEKEAKEASSKSVNEVIAKMMRSEFQEWYFKEKYFGIEPIDHAQAAWQHQQDKLDDLQLLYMQQGVNMFKMQKCLDAALEVVKQGISKQCIKKQGIGKQCSDYYLEKVEKLLEGGGC